MPVKSKAQLHFMYAAAEGKVKGGPSRKVAREFLAATSKQAKKRLPERKRGK